MKRTSGAASPFRQPAGVSEFVLVPVTGALAVAAVLLIARVMYALPWPADAILATMLASAWCRWLETREPL
jgi:hypothetical protein